jgi:lipopolysaccharide export system permease protein
MHTLDRYILGEFIKKFLLIFLLFAVIMLLKNVLGELGYMLGRNAKPVFIVLFFLYSLPIDLVQVTPVSVILAMMFSIGALAKRKEILAMHACGVSYSRMAVPLGVAVVLITLGVYVFNETMLPHCWRRVRFIEKVEIKGQASTGLTRERNITTKGKGNRFYTMKSFDSEERRMENPTITDLMVTPDGHRSIAQRIDAEYADLLDEKPGEQAPGAAEAAVDAPPGELERQRYWQFHNATVIRFDAEGRLTERREYDEILILMEEDLDRFLATNKKDQEMNSLELYEFVRIQGERNKGRYYRRLLTEFHSKLAFPLATFILGMLGFTFAIRSSIRSIVVEFGLAIACIVLWYAFFASAPRLGRFGFVPPFVAAWYANIVFLLVLAWRFRDLERVPNVR